jgi:oxygen-dependent protoporphyrinogen oxidase
MQVTILEKASRLGGNIHTELRDGFRVECGPNGFLDSKPTTLKLCRDLGLSTQLIPASEGSRKNRYLFWKGKLRALPSSLGSFITSNLLTMRGKINLLLERYRRRPKYLQGDESIADFARRRAGREAAEIFADAMVTGIHGGDAKLLSLPAAFPRVALFERQYGSVMKGFTEAARQRRNEATQRGEMPQPPRMWSFHEGLQVLIDRLSDFASAKIFKGVSIRSIGINPDTNPAKPSWTIHGEGNDQWSADAVVLACPAYQQAAIVGDLDPIMARSMESIPYNVIAVVALGFPQANCPGNLDGFGYIAPQATKGDVLGVQWCSSIFPARAPDGMVLWRALCGGWHRRDVMNWSDNELTRAVLRELRHAMKVRGEPVFRYIVRWPNAIPQYTLGHLDRVAAIEERVKRHPGLFVAGNAYHGVAMNDCTEQAELVAGQVAQYFC